MLPLISSQRTLDCVLNNPDFVAGKAYLERWNDEIQSKIDENIDKHRKADACVLLDDTVPGTPVEIEQIEHDFKFGAHIFNFDQLGSDEVNDRYKELYGTLFNSATIAFYWRTLELIEGCPRFAASYEDTADFWNSVKDPMSQPHWRRPATDPVVEFCERKGVRLHGHNLTWGQPRWHQPLWMRDKLPLPYRREVKMVSDDQVAEQMPLKAPVFENLSADQLEALMPEFTTEYNTMMTRRILEIALRYKDRIHSWDVVNESATDHGQGVLTPGSGLCKSHYGLMPGDYAYRSFKVADAVFPKSIKLNINDYNLSDDYLHQVQDLLARGCKIDVVGAQMHLFEPKVCQNIAEGNSDKQSPALVQETMDRLAQTGLPLHLSEITIASPALDERGQLIQALLTRNLYRLWFSQPTMSGITWWNVLDDCGAPGEPSVSGLFQRNMQPKASFHMLNHMIHSEWKTRLSTSTDSDGQVRFRGFRGRYRLSWHDSSGTTKEKDLIV